MRLSYANVTATLALVVALGGTSYAAIKLPKDSVRARQIAPGAVGSSEVRDGELVRGDFKAGELVTGVTRLTVPPQPSSHGDCGQNCEGVKEVTGAARCPLGSGATGGGVDIPDRPDARLLSSKPIYGADGTPTGWSATAEITITQSPAAIPDPYVYVVCAS